jgi:ferredoxin
MGRPGAPAAGCRISAISPAAARADSSGVSVCDSGHSLSKPASTARRKTSSASRIASTMAVRCLGAHTASIRALVREYAGSNVASKQMREEVETVFEKKCRRKHMAIVTFSSPTLHRDVTVYATAGDTKTVLSLAEKNEVKIPHDCREGGGCSVGTLDFTQLFENACSCSSKFYCNH